MPGPGDQLNVNRPNVLGCLQLDWCAWAAPVSVLLLSCMWGGPRCLACCRGLFRGVSFPRRGLAPCCNRWQIFSMHAHVCAVTLDNSNGFRLA